MSQRSYTPDEPAEGEEDDELIPSADSNETLDGDRSETRPANTSSNEAEQSFVGKIRDNVSSVLSRMIRTAKDRIVASTRLRDREDDHSDTQPAKRRRLQETDEGGKPFPVPGSRVDRSCQTNQSDTVPPAPADRYSRTNRNVVAGSISVTSVFARTTLSFRSYGESSVFRPPVSHHKLKTEPGGKRQREEIDEDEEEQEEEEEQAINSRPKVSIEPFDPYKFLAQNDKTPIDPKRRLTGFLGNRCYQRRQQQLRRGVVGKYFFASHHKSTKNLDSASSSESSASSQRSYFSRAAYRAASGQRIPPEYGGSSFYNGFTCYGGASSVNTLGTRYTDSRSNQYNSVLVRKPKSDSSSISSASSSNITTTSAQETSTTKQRLMDIWQEYEVTKRRVEGPYARSNVGSELNQMVSRVRPYAGTSCIPQMLQILREQKLTSVANVRKATESHPPTTPLIDVRPLTSVQPIAQRERIAASVRKPLTEATKTSTAGTDPVPEAEVCADSVPTEKKMIDQPAAALQRNKSPSEPWEDYVPKCDASESSRSPSPVENDLDDVEVSLLSDEYEDEQQEEPPFHKTLTSSPIATAVQDEPDPLFIFADPIVMNAGSDRGAERCSVPVQFLFDEPELLQQPQTIRSFRELMAESASKWICDVCMIRNEPHQLACVACESAKPSNQAKEPASQPQLPPSPIGTPSSSSSFAAIVSVQSARWECDACCVRNEPSAVVCVCCGTAKSNGGAGGAAAAPVQEPEQPQKANNMTTMPATNPTADSPFSNMPNLKDTFKSLLERQDADDTFKRAYDLCQTPDAFEQRSSGCEQPQPFGSVPNTISQGGTSIDLSPPNNRFGTGSSAFNGVHSFGVEPAGIAANPFQTAATVSQPFFATAATRSNETELQLPSSPPKPFTFTGLKSSGDATMQSSSKQPLFGGSMFGAGNIQTNANNANNNNDGWLSWEKSDATAADNNPFGLFAQSAPLGGFLTDNTSTSIAPQSAKPVFQFSGVPQSTPSSVQYPPSPTQTRLVARRLKHRGVRRLQSRPT
ncbi:nuclear pore complex protein Nup153-like [Anopheles stephensi]|uniref:nuclear pore complex protein Nup153-like n=1 Tax=Anopheles stephensi TaxID=30069 RepID=UPI001658A7C6|nr:nuclear pore complex protein Nup153-like [Anopheles stephensi]XP_035904855.1 nuclear pore complex protein Nup153-like [Anopheles stephensi]XP_035904864.1 nuclear pore complex protein Nup153-like [Anopheles stephensi]